MNKSQKNYRKNHIAFFILIIIFAASILFSVSIGAVDIPISEILNILFKGEQTDNTTILFDIRLPRVLLASILGAGLAAVGGIMQGVFQNPLVDSYTLGMSSGAALGAVISLITGISISFMGYTTTGIFAFVGAVATLFIVYGMAYTKNRVNMNSLLLAGVTMSFFLASFISFLMMLNHDKIEQIVFWTMGSLSLASWDKVLVSFIIITPCIVVLIYYSPELNIMSMGEESASHIGINTARLRNILLLFCAIIVGCVVSTGGTIGFLGLVAPHIMRIIFGADNKRIIPYSAIAGAVLLILSDTIGRILIQPAEIPVGIMTSLMGGPFFIFILRKGKMGKAKIG